MGKEGKETIAIFGGSFDPPHKGHQLIVLTAIKNLDVDRLVIVPAYLNPFKESSLAPAPLRLEWCHTLFDSLNKVTVSDYEILQGKSTFTVDTVKHFQNEYNVKYLIIGSDNLESLTKWHAYEWLNSQITWVIATRKGNTLETDMLRSWEILELDAAVSSTHIRNTQELENVDSKISESVKKLLKDK